jgi:hypothetical protein
MTDSELLASVQAELVWDLAVNDSGIVASVKGGVVALEFKKKLLVGS